ncbi:MAG: hypothetical protein MRY64_05505 [Hyphomonadaceae bacterium]|nr:hypothetical protein [Hyphomonadaceae bacterium]
MLKLVKAPEKPRAAQSLTMGGPPPARFPTVAPALTYAQVLSSTRSTAAPAMARPAVRLVSSQG